MKLIIENSKQVVVNFTADEVNLLKYRTEYGGDYKYINQKLEWNKPAQIIIRSNISILDLLSYIVEDGKDDIEKSIKAKLDIAYKQLHDKRNSMNSK